MRWLIAALLFFWASIAYSADVEVETNADTNSEQSQGVFGPFWSSPTRGAIIYHDSGDDPSYRITTDTGATWGTDSDFAGETLEQIHAAYDKDAGLSTYNVHVITNDSTGADAIEYHSLDVSDGTTSSSTIDSSVTLSGSSIDNRNCIGVAKSGRIYAAFMTGTENRAYFSDNGSTWTQTTPGFFDDTTSIDLCIILPANSGDSNDVSIIYHDQSASELSIKIYDATGDSLSETSIGTNITTSITDLRHFDAVYRLSDDRILVAAHNDDDATTDDIQTWEINPNSTTTPSVTAKTNVATNISEAGLLGMFINQQNDDVYVSITSGSSFRATTGIDYYTSTDDMATWSTANAYSEDADDDLRALHAGHTVDNDGGNFMPVFYNDDLTSFWVNTNNAVAISAATAGPVNWFMVVD